ncbi:MAG: hypothetical protein RSB41_00665 [Bacilli bacterium]
MKEFFINIVLPCISLALLMMANILAGKSIADIKKEFNRSKLIAGITKAVFTLVSIFLISLSSLVYNLDIASINGVNVNALKLMNIILIAVIIMHGVKATRKIIELFQVKVIIDELREEKIINIERKDLNE